MADKILFKSGLASKLNEITKIAGQLLFAIDGTSGSIYLDKDSTTRIKMNLDATKLQNARTINGTAFDGTQNITTTKWGNSRTLTLGTDSSGSVSINGSTNVTLNVTNNKVKGYEFFGGTCPYVWYKSAVTYTNTTAPTDVWYVKITLNAVWVSDFTPIYITADYSNHMGRLLLNLDGLGNGWSGYLTTYNNSNIQAIRRVRNEIYVKLATPVSYNGSIPPGNIKVYSPYVVESITVCTAEEAGSLITLINGYNSNTSIKTTSQIYGNASTTDKWKTARSFSISNKAGAGTAISVDGSQSSYTLTIPSTITDFVSISTKDLTASGTVTANKFSGPLTGNADSASKLTVNAGDSNTPVYFEDGIPKAVTSIDVKSDKAGVLDPGKKINGTTFTGATDITTASWGTARTVTISDNDGTNTQANNNIDGSANFTLKLPATIKATLSGKASTAGHADTASSATTATTCTGNAETATKLQTARNIFGRPFDGTADVAGRALMYGDYNSDINNHPFTAALEIRENGLVGVDQTDIKYAPEIGFHWAGHCSGGLALGSDTKFRFLTGNGSVATLIANLEGNADTVDNYHSASLWRSDGATWNEGANVVCTGTGEWSFDVTDTNSTPGGAYWHVWSGNTGSSILSCHPADGRVIIPAHLSVGGYDNRTYSLSTNSFICNSWIRTVGDTGWYNETYGGGLFMDDSTWVKVFNNKKLYVSNTDSDAIYTSGGVVASYLRIDNGNSSGYVELSEDGEGGTIRLIGPNGSKLWEMDCWNSSDLRIFSHDGSNYQFFVFGANGNLSAPSFSGNLNGNASSASLLNPDSSISTRNSFQYFNFPGTAGAAVGVNDTPTAQWWHILRHTHDNSAGYYTDVAIPFNENNIYYKRVMAGSVQNGGWVMVYDTQNLVYSATAPSSPKVGTIWLQPI